MAGVPSVQWLGWLEYLNALALVKLGITLVKYLPQVCHTPLPLPLYPLAVFSPILLVLSLCGAGGDGGVIDTAGGAAMADTAGGGTVRSLQGCFSPRHGGFGLPFSPGIGFCHAAPTLFYRLPPGPSQVWLNYTRRSTDGWNIDNVLLDFTGGVLSLTQLLLDAGCARDWTKVSGDPVKFGLGLFSMFFDIVFILQHYVWYREDQIQSSNGPAAAPERAGAPMTTPLLLERRQSGSVRAAPLGHAAQ